MSKRIAIHLAALGLLLLLISPVSFADDKDSDIADRIYEKYKEREQNKRQEKRSRTSNSGSETREREASRDRIRREERRESSRERRSSNQTNTQTSQQKSDQLNEKRESYRERREYEQRKSSTANEQKTRERRTYTSPARDERSSRETGEQVAAELRNLFNRTSRQRQSTESQRNIVRSDQTRTPGARQADTGENVSLDQAVNIVRRQTDGKVISAKSEGSGSSRKHRIKVLIGERRVRTYVVSASTGKVY